jgi:hypothetical protein
MQPLYADALAPITSDIAFIEASCEDTANAFVNWQAPVAPAGARFSVNATHPKDLEDALQSLQPLMSVQRTRYLFVGTTAGWTAYFDNGASGSDAPTVGSFLARKIGCRAIRVFSREDTVATGGAYGGAIFELYGPTDTEFLNYVRTIAAVNDGGSWDFSANGEVQPFENQDHYKARRIKDRLNQQILTEYASAFGLRPFDPSFYRPENAILVERHGALPTHAEEFDLQRARARLGL